MGSTYKGSYSGIGAMLRSDFMKADMMDRAERVAAIARATAPVYQGPDDPHRGRYKADITVSGTNHGGWKGNRAAGIVTDNASEALLVEFGDSKQRGHRTLTRALHAGAGD